MRWRLTSLSLIGAVLLTTLVAGCGQKGPLYHPAPAPTPATAPTVPAAPPR